MNKFKLIDMPHLREIPRIEFVIPELITGRERDRSVFVQQQRMESQRRRDASSKRALALDVPLDRQ